MLAAELAQGADVAGVADAEPGVLADHDDAGAERLDEHGADELLGVQLASSRVNSITSTASRPVASSRASRWPGSVMICGARSGCSTATGCGSKVTATAWAPMARACSHDRVRGRPGGRGGRRRSCRASPRSDRSPRGSGRGSSIAARGTLYEPEGANTTWAFASVPRSSSMATSAPSGAKAATGSVRSGWTERDPLAVAHGGRLRRAQLAGCEGRARRVRQRHQRYAVARVPGRLQLLHRRRGGEVEPADPRAPQRGQVTADAERGAEVAGQGADVGAGATPRPRRRGRARPGRRPRPPATPARRTGCTVTGRAGRSTSSPARTRA